MAAIKDHRLIALSEEDRKKKRFTRLDELNFQELQKRWQVEVFHKSFKSNANLVKSPTHTL